jgi:hypothetical protein
MWFYLMCALCILPFLSLAIERGKFDGALSWLTEGETDRLSFTQRRTIKILNIISLTAWTITTAVLIGVLVHRACDS